MNENVFNSKVPLSLFNGHNNFILIVSLFYQFTHICKYIFSSFLSPIGANLVLGRKKHEFREYCHQTNATQTPLTINIDRT